jgi:hypothetical protein
MTTENEQAQKAVETAGLIQLAESLEKATEALLKVNRDFAKTLEYRDIEMDLMMRLVEGQGKLQEAIEEYRWVNNDWVAASQ